MGPTAAGKTGLAIDLVQRLPMDIISVDSALIYRGMDIGTAKPTAEELALAPHRLIDIRDPAQAYSAAEFRREALREMAAITSAGRIPLLVGGTMLYFKALLEGLASLPAADPVLREAIEREAGERGWPALHAELAEVDPVTAARLHPNHSQRIQRALEVFRLSGRPLSDWQAEQTVETLPYRIIQLAVTPADRAVLHQRIALRFEQMLEQGLIDEVAGLRARGDLHLGLPSMRAVGYRQCWQYLDGEISHEALPAAGVAASRQLAKRQLTWLRGWEGLQWLTLDEAGRMDGLPALDVARKSLEPLSR